MKKLLALLVVLSSSAFGALAVDVATGGSDNSTTVTVSASVATGAYLVVGVTPGWSGSITGISCTGASCSFTQRSDWSSGPAGRVYTITSAPAGITAIAVTFSAAAQHSVIVFSLTGHKTPTAEDTAFGTNSGTAAAAVATANVVTACADTALVAIYNIADNPTVGAASSGWTDIGGTAGYSGGHHKIAGSFRIVSSASTYADSRTLSANKDFHATSWAVRADSCTVPGAALRRVISDF